jgi:hypothetical protein
LTGRDEACRFSRIDLACLQRPPASGHPSLLPLCPAMKFERLHLRVSCVTLVLPLLWTAGTLGLPFAAPAQETDSDRVVGVSEAEPPATGTLTVVPERFTLRGRHAVQRVVVMWEEGNRQRDVTDEVTWDIEHDAVAALDGNQVLPRTDGAAQLTARWGSLSADSQVVVEQSQVELPVSFELHVQPIMAAQGCNTGPCHGKARGQNGFALSLLGFDSEFDFAALTREARGRRIALASPEQSLLLRKATAEVPHGGGVRFTSDSVDYATIYRWIASGAPRDIPEEPTLVGVSLFPAERLLQPGETQRILVTAYYSDGTEADVTGQTSFQSNEEAVVSVDSTGLLKAGPIPGEAAVMVRFMGQIATCRVAIPLPEETPAEYYAQLPRQNFIDDLVWQKLETLGITVSPPAEEHKFLRRVYLDLIGRIPTPDEVRAYLSDTGEDRRERLIDALLERPEYADFWANKWADLLRPNPYRVGIKAVLNYDQWIRDSFRQNKPYDQFARELVTAQGSTFRHGASTLYRDRRSPDELATLISQLFLGIRLECAKCHQHPFEKWSQADFYSFAAYFARVGRKGTGLSPPISGSEEIIFTAPSGTVTHPLTGEVLPPRPLFGAAREPADADEDPREALADWMTGPENHYFAQVAVNRVWADLMGRGLVDPIDDLRATNPATNEPLLEALAEDFRAGGFDLKHLLRTITNSYVYRLSSEPTDRNVSDTRNYSRYYRSRLRAEVLWDAVGDITGVETQFAAMPEGSRAMQLWTHRTASLFLDTFGRPDPNQDPPCERTSDTTVTQALHLMNSPEVHEKITHKSSRAVELAESARTEAEIVEEVYLWVYSRFPSDEETQGALSWFEQVGERRTATEDLIWALLNTPEFVFKD